MALLPAGKAIGPVAPVGLATSAAQRALQQMRQQLFQLAQPLLQALLHGFQALVQLNGGQSRCFRRSLPCGP